MDRIEDMKKQIITLKKKLSKYRSHFNDGPKGFFDLSKRMEMLNYYDNLSLSIYRKIKPLKDMSEEDAASLNNIMKNIRADEQSMLDEIEQIKIILGEDAHKYEFVNPIDNHGVFMKKNGINCNYTTELRNLIYKLANKIDELEESIVLLKGLHNF